MRGALFLLPLGAVLTGLLLLPARAQGKGAREPGGGGGAIHLGAGSCAAQACHGGGVADERREYKLWATEDKHHKAYDVLAGSLGQRIGARLGIDPTKARACLDCHATTGVRLAKTHVLEDGVSCELCHGGAKEWLGPHATPEWKTLTKAQKERRGLRDLSSPAARARACMRCHVGGEGSDITHEIMAAGHPPLVFDAAAYLRAMPPHWKDETDLSVATWVAGLKQNAIAQLGRVDRTVRGSKGGIEFALFDCYSCHHSIYSGSVYEQQPPPGRPGELPLEMSALRVLLIADGNESNLKRFRGLLDLTFQPRGGDEEKLGDIVRDMNGLLEEYLPETPAPSDAPRYLANLGRHLAGIEGGKTRASRTELRQIVLAILSLKGGSVAPELDEALDPRTRYDAKTCARLARAMLAKK